MGEKKDAEEVKEILTVVSEKVPALIKGLVGSVFSEEVGREMGKAVGAFYSELKKSDLPAETILEMTKDYVRNFTNFSEILKHAKHD